MSLPFRPRPTVGNGAPSVARSVAIPMPWGPTPKPVIPPRISSGARALTSRALKSPFFKAGPGMYLTLVAMSVDLAFKYIHPAITAHMAGLSFHSLCSPLPPTGTYYGPSSTPRCATTGHGKKMAQLGADVAKAPIGTPWYFIFQHGYSPVFAYAVQNWVTTGTGARPGYFPRMPTAVPVPYFYQVMAPPRHVPFNVMTWPAWRSPYPGLGALPEGPHAGNHVKDRVMPWDKAWHWDITRPVNPPRVIDKPDVRTAVNSMVREKKLGANTSAAQLVFRALQAKEFYSEVEDAIDALFDAFPKKIRKRCGKNDHNCKAYWLVKEWDQLDAERAMWELVAMYISDEIIGRTYFQLRSKMRNDIFGDVVGSLGPHPEAFAEYAKAVTVQTEDYLNQLWAKPVHKLDKKKDGE